MKKARRSSTDRVLLGVCGGLGEYFGVDGDLVRVGWILLSLFGGVGVLPYVAAVLLLPEPAAAEPPPPRTARNLGLGLVAVGGWLLLRSLGLPPLGAGVLVWPWHALVPLVVVAAGFGLLWPRARDLLAPGGRLRRSVSNRVLAGVCGGLADEAGIDANVLRIALVLAAVLSTGLAALAYGLLVFVVPEAEVPAEPPAGPEAGTPTGAGQAPPGNGR